MSKVVTLEELRSMAESDLLKEINEVYRNVARLRHGLLSGKDKGSHTYRREKRQLAQMLTVLGAMRRIKSKSAVSVAV